MMVTLLLMLVVITCSLLALAVFVFQATQELAAIREAIEAYVYSDEDGGPEDDGEGEAPPVSGKVTSLVGRKAA